MPSIIDSLIVEIGLDPARFAEGRRRLEDELARTGRAVESFGKGVEQNTQKIGDVFAFMRRGAAGILGAFVGDQAAKFIENVALMDAHTSRLAQSIGLSTKELGVWQNMVRAVGGQVGDANQTFAALNDAMQAFATGQARPDSGLVWLAGLSNVNLLGGMQPDTLMRLTQGALAAGQNDQQRRQFLQFIPGMNEGMMFLALSGKMEELHKRFEAQVDITNKEIAAARDLQDKTATLETSLENLGRVGIPVLTDIVDFLTKSLSFLTKTTGDDVIAKTESGASAAWSWLVDPRPRSLRDLWNGITGGGGGAPAAGGATRGDRNNNPGNIKGMVPGATGTDSGGFAVFPTWEAGSTAMSQLLLRSYQGLTLAQIQRRWVGNEDSGYLGSMMKSTGLKAGDVPDLSDANMRAKLMRGMMGGEGTHVGGRQSSVTQNNNITVVSGKADPKAVADQIPAAMRRSSMLMPITTTLQG